MFCGPKHDTPIILGAHRTGVHGTSALMARRSSRVVDKASEMNFGVIATPPPPVPCSRSIVKTLFNWCTKRAFILLGAVHMSRASPANRADDLSHENLCFSTT